MFHRTSWEYHYDRCRNFDHLDWWINVRVHLDVVRNSGIVHGTLDGVHVCFTNPSDSTSATGAASRLLNSLNVRCVLSPIVGAKSRLLETFDLKVGCGKPRLLVEFEKMYLLFKGNICELMPNLRYWGSVVVLPVVVAFSCLFWFQFVTRFRNWRYFDCVC